MKKDKLIKRELQSMCDPEKSFEAFCRENNIASATPAKAKRGIRTWLLKAVMPALSAAAIVLAIALPLSLRGGATPTDGGQMAPVLNVYSSSITAEEVLADTDVSLLNLQYMIGEQAAFSKMYVDDKAAADNHVGYAVTAKIYGARIEDVPYVYGFTLTTAKRNVLAVLDKSVYYGCDQSVTYDGVDYKYNVSEGFTVSMHVYYTIGKYEYFLNVSPFGTAAIAHQDNYMQMFLQLAFGSVDNAELIQLS